MNARELADDLAYVRTIADEGRHAPLLGGASHVWWGGLTAAAWTVHWALLSGRIQADPDVAFPALWAGFGILAPIGQAVISARTRQLPGHTAIGNRVENAVWIGAAVALVAVSVGAIARAYVRLEFTAPDLIAVVAFAVYGAALLTTASIAKERWMGIFAFLSFGVAALLSFFLSSTWFYLAAAAGSVAVLVVPGLILLSRQPKTTV